MKVIHTADWHLGKRLENKLRLSEQEDALEELNELCDREKADLVVVAGDVFDAAVPSAESEELFYRAAVKIAKKRPMVVIAGNHDDADRLKAPFAVAKLSGIYLIGGLDNSFISTDEMKGGYGWLRFTHDGERLNLATLPFPSRSRLEKLVKVQESDYKNFVTALVSRCTECFGDGTNMFVSHLFMDDCLMSDERPMNAALLTKEVLPLAHYCALGHIHKPQCVSKSKNAYYSGSLLKYHYDEQDQKEFVVFDTATGTVTHSPIKSGKRLERIHTYDFAETMDRLASLGDCYAELTYESETPLKPSEAEKIRECPNLCKLIVINKNIKREVLKRKELTDAEMFEAYYKAVRGTSPSEETVKAFLEVIES